MKIKFIALMLAVICSLGVLASCDKDEKACESHVDENKDAKCDNCEAAVCVTHKDADKNLACDACGATLPECEAHKDESPLDNACDVCKVYIPCASHKDDNADAFCDICGSAIIVNYEQIAPPTEERVPMKVTPIPESVDLGAYIITDKEEDPDAIQYVSTNIGTIESKKDHAMVTSITTDVTGITTYKIYSSKTGEVIYTESTEASSADITKTVEISIDNPYYFFVKTKETSRTDGSIIKESITYYTYENKLIDSKTWTYYLEVSAADLFAEIDPNGTEDSYAGVTYYTFGAITWAFDTNTHELLHTQEKISLVYRPEFDEVCDGKYGYIEKDGKISVYDLSQWISCIYSYEIPNHYNTTPNWFLLANGHILVQGIVLLDDHAVSYDFIVSNEKYDLVYTLIDPVAKTEKAVEFGYAIMSIATPDERFTENAANIATILPIIDDVVAYSYAKTVVLNNDMSIAADVTEAYDYELLADGRFKKQESLDGSKTQTTVVDVNGKEIAYIPYGATFEAEYIVYDGKYYNFEMKEIFNDYANFPIEIEHDHYFVLKNTSPYSGDAYYYYYDMLSNKFTNFDTKYANSISVRDMSGYGYVVTYYYAERTIYSFYNIKGIEVVAFGNDLSVIEKFGDFRIITLSDGAKYLEKK